MREDDADTRELLAAWRDYAARQPDSVATLLALLRTRLHQTETQQREDYGADERQFAHLAGMRRPRPERLRQDAYAMAEACGIERPLGFVSAMLLAQGLLAAPDRDADTPAYRAAHDAIDDLDDPSDG